MSNESNSTPPTLEQIQAWLTGFPSLQAKVAADPAFRAGILQMYGKVPDTIIRAMGPVLSLLAAMIPVDPKSGEAWPHLMAHGSVFRACYLMIRHLLEAKAEDPEHARITAELVDFAADKAVEAHLDSEFGDQIRQHNARKLDPVAAALAQAFGKPSSKASA
jgi:hypothetical protein